MHVEPITCLRPEPSCVAEFASLPYDVYTTEEARAYLAEHPASFLAIDKPEADFAAEDSPSPDEVYDHARRLLRERQLDRTLVRDEHPCLYLVELQGPAGRQLGVMGAVAVDDYLDGTVARHELTLPAKEQDRVRHITALRAQTGPVLLAYRDMPAVDAIAAAACAAQPLFDFVGADGVRERVWRIARPVAVEALCLAFTGVERAYIADGHHRAAAAARICEQRRAEGRENDPAEAFLAVLFPASQLHVFPYDRVVADTAGLSTEELSLAIETQGFELEDAGSKPAIPTRKGEFGMYLDGSWHRLVWKGTDDALDVDVLQQELLAPVLHIEDPRTDGRLSFAGNPDALQLEELAGARGVAFALFPTSLDELMRVADSGGIMPPKSTWFEPKLHSGLALRRIW